jgi:hypothetical protein
MDNAIERIIAHRDKFQAWGSVLSVLALVAAMWVTAPTLQVNIPLAGGASASINAGYIIALGPTFIAFGQLWSFGSLVAMRQYQTKMLANDNNLEKDGPRLLSIMGPLSSFANKPENDTSRALIRQTSSARRGRSIVFFIVPILAQIIIVSHMLNNLMYFDKDAEIARFEQLDEQGKLLLNNWGIETNKVSVTETLLSKYPEGGNNYTLENSGLNEFCGAYLYLSHLKKLVNRTAVQEEVYKKLKDADIHCVPIEFPKYECSAQLNQDTFLKELCSYSIGDRSPLAV